MFKTKERDIDKANIKIGCLKEQRTDLLTMYRKALNENDALLAKTKRLERELHSSNIRPDIVTEYYDLIEDRERLQKEVHRLCVLLQERRELEFGLGRDERKRLHDELEGSRSLLEKSQLYRVSNANEIKTLSDKIYQIQTEYDDMAGLNSKLSYERNTLLKDKNKLEKKNQGLELDIEGLKDDYRDIVAECCDLIHEREGFLMGERPLEKDKKGFIERETRIISRRELMIILEYYYKVTEVELGEVRVGTPTHYICTVPVTACSSHLVNIQIAYRKKVDKE